MTPETLNSLPFTRTTKFYLNNLSSKQHHKIPVEIIKYAINEYVFTKDNVYHIDQVIGYIHRIMNRDRKLFMMQKLDINFLLIALRRDLEDVYDIINGYEGDLKLFPPTPVVEAEV